MPLVVWPKIILDVHNSLSVCLSSVSLSVYLWESRCIKQLIYKLFYFETVFLQEIDDLLAGGLSQAEEDDVLEELDQIIQVGTPEDIPGPIAQSVRCQATDTSLTADPGVASWIPA